VVMSTKSGLATAHPANIGSTANDTRCVIKSKFRYTSWFRAGSELVRSWFEAKFHYAIWFEPASNQLRTSSEPAIVMEFGFNTH